MLQLIAVARAENENNCNHILLPYRYSLYELKSHALMEYNGGLEKAILRDSELLSGSKWCLLYVSSIALLLKSATASRKYIAIRRSN